MTKTRAKQTESRRRAARGGEKIFDGLGVSPGIAIGPAHVSESGTVDVPEYAIAKGKVAAERKRLAAAVELSRRQVKKLKAKAAVEEVGYLLDAYLQMLSNSRLVRGADRRIAEDRVNAEAAVQAEISELARGFAAMDDSYLAGRIRDVRDVGARLVRNLTRKPYRAFSRLPG